jgi:hypothetical protein
VPACAHASAQRSRLTTVRIPSDGALASARSLRRGWAPAIRWRVCFARPRPCSHSWCRSRRRRRLVSFSCSGWGSVCRSRSGVVVQVGLACRVAALRAHRRDVCLELIVAGRERLPLACVAREWRRLLNLRTAEQLAGSVDEILRVVAQRPPLHPAARPIFHIGVIRRVAPELHQVASLLRAGRPCVRGVAAVEWLLTSAESPLYDVDVESLRRELGRVRYLLGLTS